MGLHGKSVLITRAVSQTGDLREALRARGARVVECPAIEIVPVDDLSEIDRAIDALNAYQWVMFTSANAVEQFMRRLTARGGSCTIPVAVVGPATAARLADWGLRPSLIPEDFRAEGLIEAFPNDLNGVRILFPRAAKAREILPEELRRRGARVDVVIVYRTVRSEAGLHGVAAVLRSEKIDAVVFTSPSAIRYFSESLGDELQTLLAGIPIAVIGPVARAAVESVGLKVEVEPRKATIPALIEELAGYFSSREGNT